MNDPRRHLFASAWTGMVVFGMILALPGTVLGLPDFAAALNLTLGDRGLFIAALFGGLLVGSVLSGPAVQRLGYRLSIASSSGAIAVLLPVFAVARSYELSVTALLGLGISSATLNTSANALSSDLFPEERGRRMTMLATAFSLGGLLLPAATAAVAHLLSWRVIVLGGAAVSAGVCGAVLRGGPSLSAQPDRSGGQFRALARQRTFVWFCVLIACGAANEGAFAGWTTTYLTSWGFTPVAATWGLASHWLGLLLGRLFFAGRVDGAKRTAIIRSAFAGAAVLMVMIVAPVLWVLACAPFVAGVAIGVIVPTSLAFAGERMQANPGPLFGALLTMAQVGGMLLPPAIGTLAQATSLRAALLLAVANVGAIAVVAWRLR